MRIVDFEELGSTTMPLHDQLGLALSVYELSHESGALLGSPRDDIDLCTRDAREQASFALPVLPGLLWHHLLYRIDQCMDRPRRIRRLESLLNIARWFARAPDDFLPTV